MVAVNRTPKLKVFYPAPEEFECDNLTDILRTNPRVRRTRLAISSIRRNRKKERGSSPLTTSVVSNLHGSGRAQRNQEEPPQLEIEQWPPPASPQEKLGI